MRVGAGAGGRGWWRSIRRVWITTGLAATAIFVVWSLVAFRARPEAQAALLSDVRVTVTNGAHHWLFMPAGQAAGAGLLFYPGALPDPVAYAPIVRAAAEAGFPGVLVRVPRRGAFGGAEGAEPLVRGTAAMANVPDVRRWVVAGHSRGGEIASRLVRTGAPSLVGLVLIGTSHPRDFSLAGSPIAVTRIFGTRDTVADEDKVLANSRNLPPSTRSVRIDGGNHSQFAWYGFQPGDWPATIGRDEQQRITIRAVIEALAAASRPGR